MTRILSIVIAVFFITALIFPCVSCNKILNDKPDQSLVVPTSLSDFQALLDNTNFMNFKSPSFDEASADNYYLPVNLFNALASFQKEAYLWENDVNFSAYPSNWGQIYDVVYYSNIALEGVSTISPNSSNILSWNNIKGSALFYRAFSFFRCATIFCKSYDSTTAATDYGVVLRLSPDFNKKSTRSNVKDSYDAIIQDLKSAVTLLPVVPAHVMRPSRPAAYALLARVLLVMRKYDEALKYADSCLQLKSKLIDYSSLGTLASSTPFASFNEEVIFNSVISSYTYPISTTRARVDTLLYSSYHNDDLRKVAFFEARSPNFIFKGNYSGDFSQRFTGLATDEVYLTRAECYARAGNTFSAMADLNTLLKARWRAATYTPLTISDAHEAIKIILEERRKELLFRGIRWMDIKRLNKEGANIILKRIVNGNTYTLLPNDNRYALPLPADVVNLGEIPQNPQ